MKAHMNTAYFSPEHAKAEPSAAADEASLLSSLVERRQTRQDFIARSLRSRENALQSGQYVSADTVIERLEKMLASTKGGK